MRYIFLFAILIMGLVPVALYWLVMEVNPQGTDVQQSEIKKDKSDTFERKMYNSLNVDDTQIRKKKVRKGVNILEIKPDCRDGDCSRRLHKGSVGKQQGTDVQQSEIKKDKSDTFERKMYNNLNVDDTQIRKKKVRKGVNILEIKPDCRDGDCSRRLHEGSVGKQHSICNLGSNDEIILFVAILTSRDNYNNRQTIRSTWVSISQNNTSSVRYMFVTGKGGQSLDDECKKYNDIVMGDFRDNPELITQKTMFAMQWFSKFCTGAKFFMKLQDDVFVNLPRLLRWLRQNQKELKDMILSNECKFNESVPLEDIEEWQALQRTFGENKQLSDMHYPPYCATDNFITSGTVLLDLNEKYLPELTHVPSKEHIFIGLGLYILPYKVTLRSINLVLYVDYSKKDLSSWVEDIKGGGEVLSFHSTPLADMPYLWTEVDSYSKTFYLFLGKRDTKWDYIA